MTNIITVTLDDNQSCAWVGDLHADSQGPESRIDNFMDTVVVKLEDICDTCVQNKVGAIFFTGDMFSRVTVPHDCVDLTMKALLRFKSNGIRAFAIVGNHDIARNQIEKLKKSPLQILFTAEALEQINLENRVVLNKRTLITPVAYTEYPVPKFQKAKYNILLAHMFYNASDLFTGKAADGTQDNRYNIVDSNVIAWDYDAIVLGHDHVEYPIMTTGKTTIIRPGSVTRATSHEYNFNRIPCFYILNDPSNYDSDNWVKHTIKALPFDEVASSTVRTKKALNKVEGLQDLLASLAEKLVNVGGDKDDDFIISIIRNDDTLSGEVKQLLFQYFTECGIKVS